MAITQNTDHFQSTHVGSLPRSERLLQANKDRRAGALSDADFLNVFTEEVDAIVARQAEVGVSIVNDGEYGHTTVSNSDYGSWWTYSFERTGGLEIVEGITPEELFKIPGNGRLNDFGIRRDWNKFADFYSTLNLRNENDGVFPVATGELSYIGQDEVQRDISTLKSAAQKAGAQDAFVAALSPGSAARIGNKFYATDEEWIYAWADVLREEYKAIADAGLTIQIDDPSFAEAWDQLVPEPTIDEYLKFTQLALEALNYALKDISQDQVRYHLCWGSWHGPHTTDIELKHIQKALFSLNVGGYTFEAANARHAHEWKVWEGVDLEGKILYPGLVSHSTNVVEHPELVAQRLEQFASVAGKENVVASTDCGLGGRLHEDIAWAKLSALTEGARIASEKLFS